MIDDAIATFEQTRPTGWWTLLPFGAATATYVTASVVAVEAGLLDQPVAATHGLVDQALLCSAAALLVITGGILFGIGRLKRRDVGLLAARMPLALAVTLALWLLAQLVALIIGLIHTGGVTLHHGWDENQPSRVVGHLLGQLFGNALFEETAYRGFLLPQIYLLLAARSVWSAKTRLIAGVAISQAFFALMHIPIRLHQGTEPAALPLNLLATVCFGIFLCWVYLQTGNLFIAVGVHALINRPTSLLECALTPQHVLLALVILVLLLWPWLVRVHRPPLMPDAAA
jgi:membrane protease YdiL (CAAX protease family)